MSENENKRKQDSNEGGCAPNPKRPKRPLEEELICPVTHELAITTMTPPALACENTPARTKQRNRWKRGFAIHKQQQQNERPLEEELICPITHALPWEPVVAEDGRTYERSAIEAYFQGQPAVLVKSPMTNKMIRKQVFPAVQIKNTIEASIENSYITGDLAKKWKAKEEEKKQAEKLLKQAEEGDVNAMETVGSRYSYGHFGFKKDEKKAFKWLDRARISGSIRGLTEVGNMLIVGVGIEMDKQRGFMYLCVAAEKGSDWAAYWLGQSLAEGTNGLAVNYNEAKQWLEASLSDKCPSKVMDDACRQTVEQKLEQVKSRLAEGS